MIYVSCSPTPTLQAAAVTLSGCDAAPGDCVLKWPEDWEEGWLSPEPSALLAEPHVCPNTGCLALLRGGSRGLGTLCHLSLGPRTLGPGTLAPEAGDGVLEEGGRNEGSFF